MPFPKNLIDDFLAVLPPNRQRTAPPRREERRSGAGIIPMLIIGAVAGKLISAVAEPPETTRHQHARSAEWMADIERRKRIAAQMCVIMSDDELRQVGVLLLKDPEQREHIEDEMRFKGWCVPDAGFGEHSSAPP